MRVPAAACSRCRVVNPCRLPRLAEARLQQRQQQKHDAHAGGPAPAAARSPLAQPHHQEAVAAAGRPLAAPARASALRRRSPCGCRCPRKGVPPEEGASEPRAAGQRQGGGCAGPGPRGAALPGLRPAGEGGRRPGLEEPRSCRLPSRRELWSPFRRTCGRERCGSWKRPGRQLCLRRIRTGALGWGAEWFRHPFEEVPLRDSRGPCWGPRDHLACPR